ncbi:MAG: HIT family protein [bacterium JZ-2024 1]
MKQVWAPWRMEYISSKDKVACFLCDIVRDHRDEENLVLSRGKFCFVVLNLYPYTNGHLMVAPLRHIPEISQLTDDERLELFRLSDRSIHALRLAQKAQGFNVGFNLGAAAGAGLEDHIHLHIVPRWFGDTNFMPVLGEVKVISQHLRDTYNELKPYFAESRNA